MAGISLICNLHVAGSCRVGGGRWCLPGYVWGMRTRPPAGRLVAVAALCAFAQLAAAWGGPAGPSARPAPAVSHRQEGSPPGTSAAGSPPGGSRPAGPSSPRAGWAVPGSVISNLDTAPGSPYHRGEKVVALTFDDGPSPVYTLQIMRILAAARAPASFEIIGLDGAAYPGILRAENAAGRLRKRPEGRSPFAGLLGQSKADRCHRQAVDSGGEPCAGPAGRARRSKVPHLSGQRPWRARPGRWRIQPGGVAAERLCCLAWRTAGRDRQGAAPAGAVEAPGPAA